jgi:NAD+ synthase
LIGISGGKDSTICCALLCEAIGKDRVIGLLMPNGDQHDIEVSKAVCDYYGIKNYTVNIQHAVNTFKRELELCGVEMSQQTAYNIPPRVRMTTLYAFSQSLNGRVVNTSNLSEDYVGWMTMFGDAAGDFSPLSFLTVTEVKNLGYEMGVPREWVDKIPEDGLVGTSDEDALGVTYKQIDEFVTTGKLDNKEAKDRIVSLINKSAFKLRPMAAFRPTLEDLHSFYTVAEDGHEHVGISGIHRFKDKRQPWNAGSLY